MITRIVYKFSNGFKTIFENKVQSPQMLKIQEFCLFFQKIKEDAKNKSQNNDIKNRIEKMKSFDLETNNYDTYDWLMKNIQRHDIINQQFNELIGAQLSLINHGLKTGLLEKEYVEKYIKQFSNYLDIVEPTLLLNTQIFSYLNTTLQQNQQFNQQELKILMVSIDAFKEQIPILRSSYLATQFYYLSKLNISVYSVKLFFEIFVMYTRKITELFNQFDSYTLKSIYYTIGKHGFYNKTIKQLLFNKLEQYNHQINSDSELQEEINFFLCISNIFYDEIDKNKFFNRVQYILNQKYIQMKSDNNFYIQLFLQLIRLNCFEEKIWDQFFIKLDKLHGKQKGYIQYQILLNQSDFCKNQQEIIQKIIEPKRDELIKMLRQDKDNFTSHYMEKGFQSQFIEFQLEFECNIFIAGFEIDLYIPKYNLIIEVAGPIHYCFQIDCEQGLEIILGKNKESSFLNQKENLLTSYKRKQLEKLGYNVLIINFMDQRISNFQQILLKYLLQFQNKK